MTERELDKVKAAFSGLDKESQQVAIARLLHDNSLDEKEVYDTLAGMHQQDNREQEA